MFPFISKIRIHVSFLTLSLLRPVQKLKEMAADSLGSWVTLHCIIPRGVWLPPVRLTRQGMLPGESCFYTFLHLLHSIFFFSCSFFILFFSFFYSLFISNDSFYFLVISLILLSFMHPSFYISFSFLSDILRYEKAITFWHKKKWIITFVY